MKLNINLKNRPIKTALGIIASLALVTVSIQGLRLGAYAESDDEFSSGKLVIIAEDESLIPEGGKIIAHNQDAYLVDYALPSKARDIYMESKDADIEISPEISFVAASGMDDICPPVPGETQQALEELSEELERKEFNTYEGKNVIALIDTGSNYAGLLERLSVVGDDGFDANGHGTAMVEDIRSIDKDAKIISIKALNNKGVGSISSVYSAIKLAVEKKVKVINLSIVAKSVEENQVIKSAIDEALNANIVVVGAAGNMGEDALGYIPGGIASVIVAGACDETGKRLYSSNFGSTVDWYVTADSTSSASSKLSAFINKNCEPDKSINEMLLKEVGKGLIWSAREEISIKENRPFGDIDDWEAQDISKLYLEDYEGENEKVVGVNYSPSTDLVEVSTLSYIMPEDGEFITAGWNYATIKNTNFMKNGKGWINVRISTATGNISSPYSESSAAVYMYDQVIGVALLYTPGGYETSDEAMVYGGHPAVSEDIKFKLYFHDGSETEFTPADGTQAIHPEGTSPVKSMSVRMENPTLQYLYRQTISMITPNHDPEYVPEYQSISTDSKRILYEEEGINSGEGTVVGSINGTFNRVTFMIRPRTYSIYYQKTEDENALTYVGTNIVGSTFDFAKEEEKIDTSVFSAFGGWDYSELGFDERPDGEYIFPPKGTPTERLNYDIKLKMVIRPIEGYKISYDLNDTEGSTRAINDERNPAIYAVGDTVKIYDPTREGYSFNGWIKSTLGESENESELSKKDISLGGENGESVKLKATWTPISYRIIFDGNKSTGGFMPVLDCVFDTPSFVPDLGYTRDGYEGIGFAVNAGLKNPEYQPKDEILNITSNDEDTIRLYVLWKKILGKASITVKAEDSDYPITNMPFKLITSKGTLIRDNLVTDDQGTISVDGLMWNDPLDPENGFDNGNDNDGTEYVFVAKDVPEGFEAVRDAAFTINAKNTENIIDSNRTLVMKTKNISIETIIDNDVAGVSLGYMYRIEGTNVAGKAHSYTVMTSIGGLSKRGENTIDLPAGRYTVKAMPVNATKVLSVESLENCEISEEFAAVDLISHERGRIAFKWDISGVLGNNNKLEGALKTNSFKKGNAV